MARIEAGLIASWERLCGLLPDAAIYHYDGLVLALPGVGVPPINGVVPEAGVDPARPDEAVEVLDGLCSSHGARLLVDLAAGAHPGLEAALRQAGLRPGVRRRGMITALDDAPTAAATPEVATSLPGAGLRRRPDVGALRRLEQECFGLAPAVAERSCPQRRSMIPTTERWWPSRSWPTAPAPGPSASRQSKIARRDNLWTARACKAPTATLLKMQKPMASMASGMVPGRTHRTEGRPVPPRP